MIRSLRRRARSQIDRHLLRRSGKKTAPLVLLRSLLRPDIDRKVGLVVAGTNRGGTTALFDVVAQHPEICASLRKEVHYFDRNRFFRGEPRDHRYHAWFDPRPTHKILFEATPRYMFSRECMPRMQKYNSEMRITEDWRRFLEHRVAQAHDRWRRTPRWLRRSYLEGRRHLSRRLVRMTY